MSTGNRSIILVQAKTRDGSRLSVSNLLIKVKRGKRSNAPIMASEKTPASFNVNENSTYTLTSNKATSENKPQYKFDGWELNSDKDLDLTVQSLPKGQVLQLTVFVKPITAPTPPNPTPTPSSSPTPTSSPIPVTGTKQQIWQVTASGSDDNLPTNVQDGQLTTRWSAQGKGAWLNVDLGKNAKVDGVKCSWYKSQDGRSYTFDIGTSTAEAPTAFNYTAADLKSTPGMIYEFYKLPEQTTARNVRILFDSNTDGNNWCSMNEVEIYGEELPGVMPAPTVMPTPSPGPTTPPRPMSEPVVKPSPLPTPVTDGSLDQFGITKIYATKPADDSSSGEWAMDMNNPTGDPRFKNVKDFVKQPDGSWQAGGGAKQQVRYEGWSLEGKKWLNVEITAAYKLVSIQDPGEEYLIQLYGRGGHHAGGNSPGDNGCDGYTYKGRFLMNLRMAITKELGHSHYCTNRPEFGKDIGLTGSALNRWFVMKTVIYNFLGTNGKTGVAVEVWLDMSATTDATGKLVIGNNWKKVHETQDVGGWTTKDIDMKCECVNFDRPTSKTVAADEIITTGAHARGKSNLCAIRSDAVTGNWMYFTIRELKMQAPAP